MQRPWWKRLLDRGRGRWWPVHYRIDGSSWRSFRGKQYRHRDGSAGWGAAKHVPITVNVENLPAVELCMKRLAALGDFLDRLHDEAFPNDPYMLGRLHAEMDRLGYREACGQLKGEPSHSGREQAQP